MSTRIVIDCDLCDKQNVGEDSGVGVHLPREVGEMDGGSTTIHLCHKCCALLLARIANSDYNSITTKVPQDLCGPAFVRWIDMLRAAGWPKKK